MTETHPAYNIGALDHEPPDPRMELIIERVEQALRGLDVSRADIALSCHECLWQIGFLIRRGASVEVPEIGTFHQTWTKAGQTRIDFTPDPQLLGGLADVA